MIQTLNSVWFWSTCRHTTLSGIARHVPMSRVVLVYDTPTDATFRYVKRVHHKDLGRHLWGVLSKALIAQRARCDERDPKCVLDVASLTSECGSNFLSDQLIQTLYEIGREYGIDQKQFPMHTNGCLVDKDVMGVFYIQ